MLSLVFYASALVMTSSISALDRLTNLWLLFLLLLPCRGLVFSLATCTCSEISLSTTELSVSLRIVFSISIEANSSFSFSSSKSYKTSGSNKIPGRNPGIGRPFHKNWKASLMSFTCSLFSDKVRCFNQSERALYGNFIVNMN